jgi:hypothetical protein
VFIECDVEHFDQIYGRHGLGIFDRGIQLCEFERTDALQSRQEVALVCVVYGVVNRGYFDFRVCIGG